MFLKPQIITHFPVAGEVVLFVYAACLPLGAWVQWTQSMRQRSWYPMEKIQMTTPLVEMDGDEMTRILWADIKDMIHIWLD